MGIITVKQFSFSYPGEGRLILSDIQFSIAEGEFIILCGKSGCGKTTLLRSLKSQIAPAGKRTGQVQELAAEEIGFVFQNPENQIVTDTVRHELAFGLENMGLPTGEIRQRVAETALFFGIDTWIDRSVHQISGGEKQLLNLAAVIAMRPKLLLLDEPTSQLDPVARKTFLDLLVRVNRELGIAVLVSEHHLEDLLPLADRVFYMEEGKILFDGIPQRFVSFLYKEKSSFLQTLPAAVRIALQIGTIKDTKEMKLPFTVREGRAYLRKQEVKPKLQKEAEDFMEQQTQASVYMEMKGLWFRYEKHLPFVLKGLSMEIKKQTIHMILGGNGSGKTTLLWILAKRFYANRGKIKITKKSGVQKIALLSQNPKAMFSCDTVREELQMAGCGETLVRQLHLVSLLQRHPYDLSGGEQQRVALAMVLAKKPDLLLLDEPTKGLDPFLKEQIASYLQQFVRQGGTVVCVTHDVEFAARYGEICSLLFEGEVLSTAPTRKFFAQNAFYTTDAARVFAKIVEDGLLCEDIIDGKADDDQFMAEKEEV